MLLPILMAAELLEEQVPSSERELLQVIRGNAQRGSKLLKQLLTFGRGSASERSPTSSRGPPWTRSCRS